MRTRLCGEPTTSKFLLLMLVGTLLMLAVPAAVVFAQAEGGGDDVQYNAICQNIIGTIGDINQSQQGSANAISADGESTGSQGAGAVAEVAQEQNVSIEQVNECLNGAAAGGTTGETTGGTTNATTGDPTADTTGDTTASTLSDQEETAAIDDVIEGSIPEQEVLANTGGFPLLAWSALTLVVAAVIGARVIGRR